MEQKRSILTLLSAPRNYVPECTVRPLAEGQRHDVGSGGRHRRRCGTNKATDQMCFFFFSIKLALPLQHAAVKKNIIRISTQTANTYIIYHCSKLSKNTFCTTQQ